jgi:hypothetical protein
MYRLEEAGYGIGLKLVELIGIRERATKRETRLVNMLQYVSNVIWRHLFNKAADNLERSMENEDEYMIHENSPITNTFVSVPSDMGQLNCAAYFAGLIAGVLDSTRFVSIIFILFISIYFIIIIIIRMLKFQLI